MSSNGCLFITISHADLRVIAEATILTRLSKKSNDGSAGD